MHDKPEESKLVGDTIWNWETSGKLFLLNGGEAFVIKYTEQKFQSIKIKTSNEWTTEETRNTVK